MEDFYQISITTTKAKIDINTVKPLMSCPYSYAKVDRVTHNPYFDIKTRNIKCDIDSSACRAEAGLKSVEMLTEEFAQKSLQSAKDYAHKAASDGQAMLKTFKQGNYKILEQQQKQKEMPQVPGIKFIPTSRPNISWQENDIQTTYHPLSYDFNYDVSSFADNEVIRDHSIDIEILQWPDIDIEYVGNMFNTLDTRA